MSEAAHLTSHILGPVSRSLLISPRRTQQHFSTLCDPPAYLSCLLCCVLPSQCPIRCSTQFSHLCLRHPVTQCLSTYPTLKAPVLPNAPSVTFPVPLRSFHAPLTHSWETLPDSLPFSLHHSTANLSLLPRCHPSLPQPPSAQSPRPAAALLLPSLLAATSPQTLSCTDLSHLLWPFHQCGHPLWCSLPAYVQALFLSVCTCISGLRISRILSSGTTKLAVHS